MFDLDDLVVECQAIPGEAEPQQAAREMLRRVLAEPAGVADAFQPTEGGITLLHHTPEITMIHVVWAPGMRLFPHDHRIWAVIGIYEGQEDNAFYRRDGQLPTLIESGGKELTTGDVLMLGDDTIHAVSNPLDRLTGAIHVYGGDFVNQPRSAWGPGPQEERPHDRRVVDRQFEEANRAWKASVSRSE